MNHFHNPENCFTKTGQQVNSGFSNDMIEKPSNEITAPLHYFISNAVSGKYIGKISFPVIAKEFYLLIASSPIQSTAVFEI